MRWPALACQAVPMEDGRAVRVRNRSLRRPVGGIPPCGGRAECEGPWDPDPTQPEHLRLQGLVVQRKMGVPKGCFVNSDCS